MIDADLAELHGVTTKRLNEQVKRNRQSGFRLILCFNLHSVEGGGGRKLRPPPAQILPIFHLRFTNTGRVSGGKVFWIVIVQFL